MFCKEDVDGGGALRDGVLEKRDARVVYNIRRFEGCYVDGKYKFIRNVFYFPYISNNDIMQNKRWEYDDSHITS